MKTLDVEDTIEVPSQCPCGFCPPETVHFVMRSDGTMSIREVASDPVLDVLGCMRDTLWENRKLVAPWKPVVR
jgi:hypothetical protein